MIDFFATSKLSLAVPPVARVQCPPLSDHVAACDAFHQRSYDFTWAGTSCSFIEIIARHIGSHSNGRNADDLTSCADPNFHDVKSGKSVTTRRPAGGRPPPSAVG